MKHLLLLLSAAPLHAFLPLNTFRSSPFLPRTSTPQWSSSFHPLHSKSTNSTDTTETKQPPSEKPPNDEDGTKRKELLNRVSSFLPREIEDMKVEQYYNKSDAAVFSREEMDADPIFRMISSEVAVKKLTGKFQKIPGNILIERAWDTAEDLISMSRRLPMKYGWVDPPEEKPIDDRPTVVVLGSGWAAHAFMKVADCSKIKLIAISPSNHFVFTPMLASAAVGTVEYRSMTEAVRSANPMIEEYIEGTATNVDVEKKKIKVQLSNLLKETREEEPAEIEIDYDTLIVSVGVKVNNAMVPGSEKRAFTLKTCEDARRLRTAVGECLEYASRPNISPDERTARATFFVAGGGPTGVELAGELSDLADDVTDAKGAYERLKGKIRIVLAHSGPDLVPQFEPNLREEALKSLEKKGVEVMLNTRVMEVGNGFVRLAKCIKNFDEETEECVVDWLNATVSVGVTAWCAGIAPVPFTASLLEQLPEDAKAAAGRVAVDGWMRAPMKDSNLLGSVLVLGDASSVPDKDSYLPQTAQVAGQQGAYLARLLNRGYNLTEPIPTHIEGKDEFLENWLAMRGLKYAPEFSFLNLGLLAYVGGGEALTQVQVGDVSVGSYAGSIAFILWRSVYLVKQVALRNRVLVSFDWVKSFLFGRDITRL